MIKQGCSTFILTLPLVFVFCAFAFGQQRLVTVTVTDNESGKPVANAAVRDRGTGVSAPTDDAGRAVLAGIGENETVIEVVAEGYRIGEATLAPGVGEISIALEPNEVEVVVSTTRTGRDIENTPTRVESIDEEEIDEKSSMRSSNVSMILNESTGIKVQQTSATAFTQSVRIQGLDGRYTQLLKDGFPAFGGFSGSLGILDIVPLDEGL